MNAHRVSGSRAYRWSSAWDVHEDHPLEGEEFYELPDGSLLYPGDCFWNTEEHYVVTVKAVKTKFYRGIVGQKGDRAGDYVFFERDWSPPPDPHTRRRKRDETFFIRVEEFAARIHDGRLEPHRGNGRRLPP